jgi:hypothetical protein
MLPSAKFEPSSQPPSERIVKVILAVYAFLADKGFYRPPPRLPFFIAHRFIAETVIVLAAKLGDVSFQRFPPSASILKQVSHHFGIVGKLKGSSQVGQAKPACRFVKSLGFVAALRVGQCPKQSGKAIPFPSVSVLANRAASLRSQDLGNPLRRSFFTGSLKLPTPFVDQVLVNCRHAQRFVQLRRKARQPMGMKVAKALRGDEA